MTFFWRPRCRWKKASIIWCTNLPRCAPAKLQLALITTPEPRLLVVQPFDAGTVPDIERALKESKIGITPAIAGKIIRLPIPELSEERRKELARSLSKMAEE